MINYDMKIVKGLIVFIIVFSFGNRLFSQTERIIWKDSDMRKGQKFPFAYINGLSSIEKEINAYLNDKYLNQSESYRDDFNEYEISYPKTNICRVAISFEHEFNTYPGIWSFTDNNYFDLRSGKIIYINCLFDKEKYDAFTKMANEQKNAFVRNFQKSLTQNQSGFERLNEIVESTLSDSINSYDFDHGAYELTLYSDYLELSKDWGFAWGVGSGTDNQTLPDIILKFSYIELSPLFNDYAKELLLMSNETQNKK